MKRYIQFLTSVFVILQLSSCKVDFNPNAPWQDTPVVYCLLDQDEDTTWARVQRCFLGEDNLYHYTQISDSINYPEGSIQVKMIERISGVQTQEFDFEYRIVYGKQSGQFSSEAQPMYACRTKGRLHDNAVYELLVIKGSDTLARAWSGIIYGDFHLFSPNSSFANDFRFRTGICKVEWKGMDNARLYQPVVRFYYRSHGDTLHVDVPCVTKLVQRPQDRFDINIQQSVYMNNLKALLQPDTSKKKFVDFVDITILACTEDLNAYMNSQNTGTSISQNSQIYTNIRGGVGVFAARRTHLTTQVPCDSSTGTPSNPSYRDMIRALDVGFD